MNVNNLSSSWHRLFPFFLWSWWSWATPLGTPFKKNAIKIRVKLQKHLLLNTQTRKVKNKSYHALFPLYWGSRNFCCTLIKEGKSLGEFCVFKIWVGTKVLKKKYKNVFKTTVKPLDISSQFTKNGSLYITYKWDRVTQLHIFAIFHFQRG